MTKMEDVKKVLQRIEHETARDWLQDEMRMKDIAISHKEISADIGEDLDLQGFIEADINTRYLAQQLGIQ